MGTRGGEQLKHVSAVRHSPPAEAGAQQSETGRGAASCDALRGGSSGGVARACCPTIMFNSLHSPLLAERPDEVVAYEVKTAARLSDGGCLSRRNRSAETAVPPCRALESLRRHAPAVLRRPHGPRRSRRTRARTSRGSSASSAPAYHGNHRLRPTPHAPRRTSVSCPDSPQSTSRSCCTSTPSRRRACSRSGPTTASCACGGCPSRILPRR